MSCRVDEVDDLIRKDFEKMPSHLFQDHYNNILTRYVASLSGEKSNTAASWIGSVRSFFSNETVSIRLPPGKVPKSEMAMHEHRFILKELQRMWLVADTEGKARLSTAVSLGWSVGDFKNLKTQFIRDVLANVDEDDYATFDYRRQKTRARIRGILNPCSVDSLRNYLKQIPKNQIFLWTALTTNGLNHWLRTLFNEAGLVENGKLRFHLIRKYVFDIVSSQVGVYEAKLLTGKSIPLSDITYLHGLEDRLLERYKKFAYPFLKLNSTMAAKRDEVAELTEKMKALEFEVETWKSEAIRKDAKLNNVEKRLAEMEHSLEELMQMIKPHEET